MKTYTIVLTNDNYLTKMTIETHKNFDNPPTKEDISDWLYDVHGEHDFPYDYYHITVEGRAYTRY